LDAIERKSDIMLLTLHTLKIKPFQEQIRTIELLTEQNVDLFERIRPLLEDRSEDSVFHMSVSADHHKVVRVALLAVVAADIATIPDQVARAPYRRRLDQLCNHFGIDLEDLAGMGRYASQIEGFLTGRTQSLEGSAQ
jgi:hypothetical protein